MKHKQLLFSAFALAWAGVLTVSADVVSDYTFDFNEKVSTSTHDFRVGPNWKHIVGTDNYDGYGPYYMDYSYYETGGIGGSGCLLAYEQKGRDPSSASGPGEVYDLLVTPEVKGTVTLQVKKYNEKAKLEIYSLNEAATDKDEVLLTVKSVTLASGNWVTATVEVEDFQRIGIRGNYVYMDNFTASEANIEQEYSMEFVSCEPSNTTGVIYHNQNAEGGVDLIYTVTVKNTCNAPLIAKKTGVTGTKNYSISIIGKNNSPFGAPVYVPFDLQPGETSEPFEVKVTVPADEISDWWSYASQSITMNLRENLQGTVLKRANAMYKPYESKFIFNSEANRNSSYVSNELSYGMTSEPKTIDFIIRNEGVAPLSLKSITLPAGFTTTAPTGASTVAAGSALEVPVTFDASTPGYTAGKLEVVYLNNSGAETTYSVDINGTMIPAGAWTASFNGKEGAVNYPAGVVSETALQGKYNLNGLNEYDVYLCSYTNPDYKDNGNKLITPKMTFAEGAKAYFLVARDKTASPYALKVFTSADRKNWGEPIAVYNAEDEIFADDAFHGYSIDLPAGDRYVAFAIYGMKLNDVAIDGEIIAVENDLYLVDFKQSEKVQSGKNISASVEVIPVVGAEAGTYRAIYYLGDEAVARIAGTAMEASAFTKKKFDFSVTKEVEATTTLEGKIVFEFEDGPTFETDILELTITNEPAFVFGNPGINDASTLPGSLTTPVSFGKVNEVGISKEFEIFNWGTAPLNVTSVTLPEGFSSDISEATIGGKEHQPVVITFSAETPGNYEGDITIKYMTGEGEKEFKLAVSGILLDPKKWFATFDNEENTVEVPAGVLYQKNVELINTGSSSAANFVVNSSSAKNVSDRMFITPLLKANKGEKLSFDSKIYSSNWKEGGVTVYASKTREGLINPDINGEYPDRILLGDFCGENEDEATKLAVDFKNFTVTIPEAGQYYIGFEIYSRAYVNDIFGLEKVNVPFDVIVEGSAFSSYGMQNVASNAKIKIRNVGTPVEAGSYTVKAYVDGKATLFEDTEAIPVINKQSVDATVINVPFRSPKVGKFPVYFEIRGEGKTLTTEPMNVTFEEEVLSSEKQVGSYSSKTSTYSPLYMSYHTSESVSLYTPAQTGFIGGEKIRGISFKGYRTKWDKTKIPQITIYYEWTDDMTQAMPASSGAYNTDGMTLCYDEPLDTEAFGSSSYHENVLGVTFDSPITVPADKSLRLLVRSTVDGVYQSVYTFEISDDIKNTFYHRQDTQLSSLSEAWKNDVNSPVLYLDMVVESHTVSGTVRNADDSVVADADVTLTSTDGDNVQYTGKTGADGTYTIAVLQTEREYSVSAVANGKEDFVNGISAADASVTDVDLQLIDVVSVSDNGEHSATPSNAVVYVEKALNPGFNAVAFPIALTQEEVETIFGEDVVVLEFDQVTTDAAATVVNFKEVIDKEMEAGKPYLIFADKESKEISFKTKSAISPLKTSSATATDFLATEKRTPITEGMFTLADDNFVAPAEALRRARAVSDLPAYSGYIKAPNATSLTFTTNVNIETGIEDAEIIEDAEDVIYDLNGLRVRNPQKGIYIVNGNAVMVK